MRDGAVEYVAPVQGATTSAESGATRCELREMAGPDRADKATWRLGTGIHALACTLTCDPTTIRGGERPRRECIVGQVHSSTGTPPLHLAVDMNSVPGTLRLFLDHEGSTTLLTGLRPDTVFSYRIEAEGGTCRVWAAPGGDPERGADPTTIPVSRFRSTVGCYFKAGAYNKTRINRDPERASTGGSVVRHLGLRVV